MKALRIPGTIGLLPVVLFSLGVLVATGCSSKKPQSQRASAPAAPLATYTVRGVVTALPDRARKGSPDLMVHHEPIPDFKDRDGKVVGMGEMTMPFPLADGVTLDGVAIGDKLELVFEVDWSKAPAHHVRRWTKLDAQTELNLKK